MENHEMPSKKEIDAFEAYLKSEEKTFDLADKILLVAQYLVVMALAFIVYLVYYGR